MTEKVAEHSLFSASGGDGWSVCHGKPAMEEGRKGSSIFADEGTAAHELGKWVLDARLAGRQRTAADYIGTKITVKRREGPTWTRRFFIVDEDMAEHVDEYVDRFMIMSQARSVERFCEQKVYYHEYLGVPKEKAWGTSDGVAILFDQPELRWENPTTGKVRTFPAGDELQIHDLKYGAGVMVYADTLQTFLYGSGTYWGWEHVANFTRVRLVIHQPRKDHLDELVISPKEMLDRVLALRPAVPRVIEAYELARAFRDEGLSDLQVGEQLDAKGYLQVSEKGCRFCDAQAVCPAVIAEVAEGVSGKRARPEDFEDLTVDGPADIREYGGNYLAAAYQRVELIQDWCNSVLAEIDRRVLIKGEKIDGVKVVAGKKGRRTWANPAEAQAFVMTKVPGPIREALYKRELMTPAQAEKVLKSSPLTWAKLQAFIDQSEGKPAVVPISSPRQAISHKALVDEFDDLTEQEPEQPAPSRGIGAGRDRHPFR